MTTTSSLPFTTMEVPAIEDSMEMASPYQGQGDDFDIDIDIMDDQGSHMDSDMMGADDYPTSQPTLFQNDANNDADMVDEPSEGSMVDADAYAEEDDDVEVQDEDVQYEAEMQEGDQDVNVDAPEIPTIEVEAAVDASTVNEPVQTLPEPAEQSEGQDRSADVVKPSPTNFPAEEPEEPAQDVLVEPNEAESGEPEQPGATEGDHVDAAADKIEFAEESHETTESKEVTEDSYEHGEATAENLNAPQAESQSHRTKDEHAEHDSFNVHEEGDEDHQNDESLHPVKVLYQENEISLFPPLEGDSAETFFLHDEDVAYDCVGKLFSSLRGVLLDNVAENEVLVIDIDPLGIQITEVGTDRDASWSVFMLTFAQDSSHASKVTLHQILEIYLRLCRNEGTDEPEALYITLSSKLGLNSVLASLDAAAREGKGLSQIHTWDDYEDDVPTEEKAADAEVVSRPEQGPLADETGAGQPVFELHEGTPEHKPLGDEQHDADKAGEAHEEAVPDPFSGEHEAEAEAKPEVGTEHASDVKHEEVAHEFHQTDEAQSAQEDDQFEDRYDSEAQNTESSATLANEHAEDAYGYAGEGAEGHEDTNDQYGEDTNCDSGPEHNGADAPNDPGEIAFEESLTEHNAVNDETAHQDMSFHEAKVQYEFENGPSENLTGDVDDVSYDQSESTLQNAPAQDVTSQDRTPEPEGDDFGAAEDLTQIPAKDHNDQQEHTEGLDEEQYGNGEDANEDELGAPPAEPDGGDDFDDDFPSPDWEVTEAVELGGTDALDTDPQTVDIPPTKRSREEDEEWDTAATVTSDIKRRRS